MVFSIYDGNLATSAATIDEATANFVSFFNKYFGAGSVTQPIVRLIENLPNQYTVDDLNDWAGDRLYVVFPA